MIRFLDWLGVGAVSPEDIGISETYDKVNNEDDSPDSSKVDGSNPDKTSKEATNEDHVQKRS